MLAFKKVCVFNAGFYVFQKFASLMPIWWDLNPARAIFFVWNVFNGVLDTCTSGQESNYQEIIISLTLKCFLLCWSARD